MKNQPEVIPGLRRALTGWADFKAEDFWQRYLVLRHTKPAVGNIYSGGPELPSLTLSQTSPTTWPLPPFFLLLLLPATTCLCLLATDEPPHLSVVEPLSHLTAA